MFGTKSSFLMQNLTVKYSTDACIYGIESANLSPTKTGGRGRVIGPQQSLFPLNTVIGTGTVAIHLFQKRVLVTTIAIKRKSPTRRLSMRRDTVAMVSI